MIGTAGHVDHGKTSLLQRLTEGAPHADRLPEEKSRGLTIDIGYAELTLGGRRVGIVDVPGHEKFVRNMVAAASGIDLVLLVVAADDGVMPQTREHLEIAELMGATAGVVALTKIDLVDEELALFAEEDIRELLAGTFLDKAPIRRVSSATGDGVAELREHLLEELSEAEAKDPGGIFRVPVQRSFMLPGHGTVVTGVPLAGTVRVGDTLEVMPGEKKCRVRAIQAYHEEVSEGRAGHRTALKLSDVSRHEVGRGDVVGEPGFLRSGNLLAARFRYLPGRAKPISSNFPVRFHSGTVEVVGRIFLLDRKKIRPGEDGLVQIRLDRPVVVGPGDRFVLRTPSPQVTLGGGRIIGMNDRKLRASQSRWVRRLEEQESCRGRPREAVRFHAVAVGLEPIGLRQLCRETLLRPKEIEPAIRELLKEGELLQIGERYLSAAAARSGRTRLREMIDRFHESEPLRAAVGRAGMRERMKVTDAVLEALVSGDDGIEPVEGGLLRRTGYRPKLSAEQAGRLDDLESVLRDGGFTPPREAELPDLIGAGKSETEKLVDLHLGAGVIVRLGGGILLHGEKLEEACEAVRDWIRKSGPLAPSDLKELLGMSRKYSIPFLEWADANRITIRQGDRRILA